MRQLRAWLALPLFLLLVWLALNNSLALEQIILGGILSLLLAWLVMPLRPLRSWPKRPLIAIRLIIHVITDVIHSSFVVARFVCLGPSSHSPGFLHIPLVMTDPHAMAALSCIITYTPGTVWAGHCPETNVLTLHILDLKGEEEHWLNIVQNRYQKPLMEIFE